RTIERQPALAAAAEAMFARLDLRNVTARVADGFDGWIEAAPFEFILVTAAAADFPAQLLDQLSEEGGKMVIPIGRQGRAQTLFRVTRNADLFAYEELMPVRFVPLVQGVAAP
ncbi:MAG: protein-L-isoaspartate O-methyltransferase, partial [Thalassobaculaceae bacterium]